MDGDEGVGVSRNNTCITCNFTLSMTGCHHSEVSLVCHLERLEKLLWILNSLMWETFRWDTNEMTSGEAWETALCSCIGAVKFSPGFLKDRHPEFSILTRGKCWRSIWTTWQMVIDNDRMLNSIDEELDHVNTSIIQTLSHEHVRDTIRELSQGTKHSEEVAVSKASLVDIIWMDTTGEHLLLSFVYLWDAFP